MRTIAILELATGVGLILFWIAFFTIGLAPVNAPPSYLDFEHAFPLPDMVLAIALLCGGYLLLIQKALGKVLSIASAGALIFLGFVDFSYNIQNGMYLISTPDLIMNAFINLWCVGFGAMILVKLK